MENTFTAYFYQTTKPHYVILLLKLHFQYNLLALSWQITVKCDEFIILYIVYVAPKCETFDQR